MKQINLICNILGASGYAMHGRSLLNALLRNHDNVRLEQIQKPIGFQAELTIKEIEAIDKKRENPENRLDIYIGLPNQAYSYKQESKHFAQFVVWEGTTIPKFWSKHLQDCEYIFTPSQHTKDAIIKVMGNIENIHIMPHGVDRNIFYPIANEQERPFTFVANKGWNGSLDDRGGLPDIIKAFAEEFDKDEARLLIKVNKSYAPNMNIRQAMDAIKIEKAPELRAEVLITEGFTTLQAINEQVYNLGDVFISASKAESFNIPCIEALSCGLPVITTAFGGQMDYISKENGWLIEGELFKPKDMMYEEAQWMQPSLNKLRKALREAYDLHRNDRQAFDKMKVKSIETAKIYNWDSTARKIISLII